MHYISSIIKKKMLLNKPGKNTRTIDPGNQQVSQELTQTSLERSKGKIKGAKETVNKWNI